MFTLEQNDSTKSPTGIRSAFFISDGTAITAETLGRSVLSQFEMIEFDIQVIPYVDSLMLAQKAVDRINAAYQASGVLPLVFDTIVSEEIREKINSAHAINLDIYEGIIGKVASELGVSPQTERGLAHGSVDSDNYKSRIDAVHFALDNDDGARTHHYDAADIILIGLSRSGKTPTSLYLALQFGIRAANYPLTEEDLDKDHLPNALKAYQHKLFGLAIDTDRLVKIREERRAGSRYASLAQIEDEQRAISTIYHNHNIPSLNVSQMSVEEIATRILQMTGLARRIG